MNLEFEVINKKIKQRTNFKQSDEIICLFKFITSEWDSVEKYVIFQNNKNESAIESLGKKKKGFCKLPKSILKSNENFSVQIYVNNNLSTNKIIVDSFIETESCPHQIDTEENKKEEFNICHEKKQRCHNNIDENYIIDNVKYENGKILFYSENKLRETIDIINDSLIKKIKDGLELELAVDSVLSEKSNHAIANKTVYNALLEFLKASDLSKIALTGDYNDLKNIPSEFTPSHHNHVVVDVIDYEENINVDLNSLLDLLGDEIAKE